MERPAGDSDSAALTAAVAEAYHALPESQRAVAAFFTPNYGESGAIDRLGDAHGLPNTVSGHDNYWLWGPRGYTGEVMILIGGTRENLERSFESVEPAGTIECGYCMPYENHQPIWIGRGLVLPLEEIWPELKHYD